MRGTTAVAPAGGACGGWWRREQGGTTARLAAHVQDAPSSVRRCSGCTWHLRGTCSPCSHTPRHTPQARRARTTRTTCSACSGRCGAATAVGVAFTTTVARLRVWALPRATSRVWWVTHWWRRRGGGTAAAQTAPRSAARCAGGWCVNGCRVPHTQGGRGSCASAGCGGVRLRWSQRQVPSFSLLRQARRSNCRGCGFHDHGGPAAGVGYAACNFACVVGHHWWRWHRLRPQCGFSLV